MQKREVGVGILNLSLFQIVLLITFTIAISYLMNQELQVVSAEGIANPTTAANPTGYLNGKFGFGQVGGGTGSLSEGFIHGGIKYIPGETAGTWIPAEGGANTLYTIPPGSEPLSGSGTGTASGGPLQFIKNLAGGKAKFGVQGAAGQALGALAQGLFWGAILYGVGKMAGNLFGLSEGGTNALSMAGLAGGLGFGAIKAGIIYGVGGANPGFLGLTAGQAAFAGGLIIAVVIFIVLYSDSKKELINFQCLPWEPALGGAKCDECNKDPNRPCSEYRCRALGQACGIVNPGTPQEQCVWISKGDVTSPTITPNTTALKPNGLSYISITGRPPALGTKIVKNNNCLDAFTPLVFGLDTNEPAQCKIDYIDSNYTDMQFYVGGTNYYQINHKQQMRLPGMTGLGDSPLIQNDGTMNLYVRCQDANGNRNEDVYIVQFCVDQGPDTTPPVIEKTSIESGSPVQYQIGNVPLEVYTNEPAQCKWSVQDKSYETMENSFSCSLSPENINAQQLYTCAGNLTAVKDREENTYYMKCRDSSSNTNVESHKFILRGSQPLSIIDVKPNATIIGNTELVNLNLELETDDGSDTGKATCFYNTTDTVNFVAFFDTDSNIHKQIQTLGNGTYTYQFRCIDAGGNIAEESKTFSVKVDTAAPYVTRAYKDQALKIVTNENAECVYSVQNCNYEFNDGISLEYANPEIKTSLYAPWKAQTTYYIKCTDIYGNQPEPNSCSAVISPRDIQ